MLSEIRPRVYARDICKLATRQERSRALENVPEHLRGMVKTHVVNTFAINAARRQS
jgi:hypothetical protein